MDRLPETTFAAFAASSAKTDAGPDSIDPRVRLELLDIAARSSIVGASATIGVAWFVSLLRESVAMPQLGVWAIVLASLSIVRIGACGVWLRARTAEQSRRRPRAQRLEVDRIRVRRWEAVQSLTALASGLAWAALIVYATESSERTTTLIGFTLTVALLLASSLATVGRTAHLLFALPIVVAQEVNLHRYAFAYREILEFGWIGLVAALYLMPRIAAVSLRDGVVARLEHERHAFEQTALIETAPLGILVVRNTRIVVCNDAVLRMFGYQRKEELLGRSLRVVVPDDEALREVAVDASAALDGPVAPRVVRRLRRDGTLIEVMRNVAAVRAGDRESGFIVTYEDIRDRTAIEESYRHAVHMQRLVFEAAGEGIAIVNDGIVEQANQALSNLIGVPTMQLTGRPLHAIFEDPQGWLEIEKRFQRLGNVLKLERRIVRSDGAAIWVNVTGCLAGDGYAAPTERPVDTGSNERHSRRSIWLLADLTTQKQKEAENWHHANHDVMTGLPNRRFLQDRLDQALAFARRDGRGVAVVELDLDGFKAINDGYGHRIGDAVLEEVARRLSTVVREFDTVGRWGGDEFVLVLKDIDAREVVEETVKRVIARLSQAIIYEGHDLAIGASIGIALFPEHGEEVEALMLAADLAMYESKASGGNTWRFPSLSEGAPRGKYRPAASQPTVPIA